MLDYFQNSWLIDETISAQLAMGPSEIAAQRVQGFEGSSEIK
jgi:hypothetical protein